MKIYIRAANVSDIQAKIAKKQAEIDKKKAWIEKKEAAIAKKFAIIEPLVPADEFDKIKMIIEYLKTNNSYRRPEEYSLSELRRKYIHRMVDSNQDLYDVIGAVEDDAESIYNSNCTIQEAEAVKAKYQAQLDKEMAKESEIDEIPDCLKDFMNEIIEEWDRYDIDLRDRSKPFYYELSRKADEILPSGRKEAAQFLEEKYPNAYDYWTRKDRFKSEYIYIPFKKEFGITIGSAEALWEKSDEKIHKENYEAGRQLILDLLNRVTKITGPVRSWDGLDVTRGNQGFLVINGIVIGEGGKAQVESIYAGGYAVQRLHIRTLVKELH